MPIPNGLGIDLDALSARSSAVVGMPESFFSPEEAMIQASQPRLGPVNPETSQAPLGGSALFDLSNPVQSITLAMFWPGDEPFKTTVNNVDYVFGAKSVTRIGPKMEHQRNAQHKVMFNLPLRVVPNVGSPDQIVTELLQQNEDKGLVLLYSDGRDNERVKIGRERYLKWRRRECEKIVSNHLSACETAMASGRPAPPMRMQVRRAQEFLNYHDAELHDRKRFVVQIDGSDFDTAAAAWTYVRQMYPKHYGDAKAVLDLNTNAPAEKVETSDAPQRVVMTAQAPQGNPATVTVDPADVRLAVLRERATYVLARAGGEGIMLNEETREGLKSETDPGRLEIHIQDAMATISGPDPTAA